MIAIRKHIGPVERRFEPKDATCNEVEPVFEVKVLAFSRHCHLRRLLKCQTVADFLLPETIILRKFFIDNGFLWYVEYEAIFSMNFTKFYNAMDIDHLHPRVLFK